MLELEAASGSVLGLVHMRPASRATHVVANALYQK